MIETYRRRLNDSQNKYNYLDSLVYYNMGELIELKLKQKFCIKEKVTVLAVKFKMSNKWITYLNLIDWAIVNFKSLDDSFEEKMDDSFLKIEWIEYIENGKVKSIEKKVEVM